MMDAYNRKLRGQLEQEWDDVRKLKAAYAAPSANVAQCATCGMAVDPKCGCSLGRAASANVAQGFLTDEQKSAVTQAADVMGANGFHWVEETLRQIVSANVAQGAEACHIDKFSSRICERGTLSCDVEHSAASQSASGDTKP